MRKCVQCDPIGQTRSKIWKMVTSWKTNYRKLKKLRGNVLFNEQGSDFGTKCENFENKECERAFFPASDLAGGGRIKHPSQHFSCRFIIVWLVNATHSGINISGRVHDHYNEPWLAWLEVGYRRFQLTFHCYIPNFVAKFGSSLRSSKVRFRIHKPVCELSILLASLSSGANHSLCLQTGLQILKWTLELCKEHTNFATKFGILQWKVTWNRR